MVIKIIFQTIAGLMIAEGLLIILFHPDLKKIFKKLSREKNLLKRIGLIELVVGILIIILMLF